MEDLIAFVRARLDEDQAAAERARDAEFCKDGRWNARGPFGDDYRLGSVQSEVNESILGEDADDVPFPFADHIARHNPARILREVEAKRRMFDLHVLAERDYGDGFVTELCMVCDPQEPEPFYPCQTLRLLALPYSDHPDYHEEWRP